MPEIELSSLTLKEKIAQMVMVRVKEKDSKFTNLNVGGIFIDKKKTREEYKSLIQYHQNNSKIKLFVATDMEGYWNPFPFYKCKSFGEIKNKDESYQLGKAQGEILKDLGFNLNFSPIVETKNEVWIGRTFAGTKSEVNEKIKFYIKGLHENKILSTAKHYPGGSMLKDPHLFRVKSEILKEDLEFFNYAIEQEVSAVMVGHAIVSGAVDSKNKQSTISSEVISKLRSNFKGLIITDAIGMLGLRLSYLFNDKKLYTDLVKAGNDIILDSSSYHLSNYRRIKRGISAIEQAVLSGEISQNRINESVTRILKHKGYKIIP